jgi:hypothetical protein
MRKLLQRLIVLGAVAAVAWYATQIAGNRAQFTTITHHLPPATTASCGTKCGTERWRVKTLSDPGRDQVNADPVVATVEELAALPRPRVIPENSRVLPVEGTVYTVTGYVGAWKSEDDHDLHIILSGMVNQRVSIIAEIPSPQCTGACWSGLSEDFARARSEFMRRINRKNLRDEPIVLTITGVGFFDRIHGQIGVAPNGFELHPVLKIEMR